MLGIDRKNEGRGAVEPGGDPGVFGGQRWSGIQGSASRGGLRVGKPDATADPLSGIEAERAGIGAALRVEDDGVKPGTKYAPVEFVPER